MFKCVLAFLSYKQSAEFRLQNAFYFRVLREMEDNSETWKHAGTENFVDAFWTVL